MKSIFLLLCTVTCIFIARMLFVQFMPRTTFVSHPDTTPLAPPTQAYEGTIKALTGNVKKIARGADDFSPIDKNQPVLQGEIVSTDNKASITIAMEKMDDILIDMSGNAEVEFANLVYPDVLLRHRRGKAIYATTTSSFSIRSFNTLVHLGTGAVSLDTQENTVTIRLQEGVANLAVVNDANETHVWNLNPGDRAVVTKTETSVYTK